MTFGKSRTVEAFLKAAARKRKVKQENQFILNDI